MFFKKKNSIRIGKIEKELRLGKNFGILRWRWGILRRWLETGGARGFVHIHKWKTSSES